MYRNKKIICIIPARGGSKGIPNKNITLLDGKPLLYYSLHTASLSKYIDRTIVSTESETIAACARRYNAEVPFLRPKQYARDSSPSFDLLKHALSYFQKKGTVYDIVVMLEPTSPIRDVSDIDRAIELLVQNPSAQAIVSLTRYDKTDPKLNMKINKTGFIRPTDPANNFRIRRRQEIQPIYYFEGSFYISYVTYLLRKKSFYHKKTLGFEVSKMKSLEIDDKIDLICAEALLKKIS